MEEFLKVEFAEQDVLDDFDLFMKNGQHKKKEYSLSCIVREFINSLEDTINENYVEKYKQELIKKHIKKVLFDNKELLYDKYSK